MLSYQTGLETRLTLDPHLQERRCLVIFLACWLEDWEEI